MQQLSKGTTLQGGKYIIERVLGQGGFGITYLAEHAILGKMVAIKEFYPKDYCNRDETLVISSFSRPHQELLDRLKKRFLKEARHIATLDHPGIVKIHDIFEENGTAYYVMDYIEGENLNEKVKREGVLPEKRAVDYIRKVGEALSYLHSRNMTHFDVKPANIVVRSSDDMPILIDFGLSKQYDTHGDATSTLMSGVSSGYSPIELYVPDQNRNFSPKSDVYSLGATLYFLLTGTVPPVASYLFSTSLNIPTQISSSTVAAIKRAMVVAVDKRISDVSTFTKLLPKGDVATADKKQANYIMVADPKKSYEGKVGSHLINVMVYPEILNQIPWYAYVVPIIVFVPGIGQIHTINVNVHGEGGILEGVHLPFLFYNVPILLLFIGNILTLKWLKGGPTLIIGGFIAIIGIIGTFCIEIGYDVVSGIIQDVQKELDILGTLSVTICLIGVEGIGMMGCKGYLKLIHLIGKYLRLISNNTMKQNRVSEIIWISVIIAITLIWSFHMLYPKFC